MFVYIKFGDQSQIHQTTYCQMYHVYSIQLLQYEAQLLTLLRVFIILSVCLLICFIYLSIGVRIPPMVTVNTNCKDIIITTVCCHCLCLLIIATVHRPITRVFEGFGWTWISYYVLIHSRKSKFIPGNIRNSLM